MKWTDADVRTIRAMRAETPPRPWVDIAKHYRCTPDQARGTRDRVLDDSVTFAGASFTNEQGRESNSRIEVPPSNQGATFDDAAAHYSGANRVISGVIETGVSAAQIHGARVRRSTERILFVPDTHIPFECPAAWNVMLDVARAVRPETIVVLGDFADMWAVSAHDKSPTRRENLESEMKAVAMRLDELDALGAKRKLYVEGNHEERLTRYMTQRAPDVFEYVQYRKIQRLDERGWQWVPYREHAKVGKVFVTHDLGEAGAYAAARARATMGGNVVIGHVHRMGVHYASTAEGTGHVSASFGWLGDASKATYMPAGKRAAWQLGFGLGYMEPTTGHVHLQAVPIVDGRCVVEGALFGGARAA